jgi:putative DNA primase/helicase
MRSIDIFREEMAAAGIVTNEHIIADGCLHRIHIVGDRRGTRNGWYILFENHPVIGVFGCWKRHIQKKVVLEYNKNWPTRALRVFKERHQQIEQQLIENYRDQLNAQKQTAVLWQSAPPAIDIHGYLRRKQVRSFGLRYDRGALLVPVMDAGGRLHGLQRIWPSGDKRFMKGTILSGNFYLVGDLVDNQILLAEGYSTAATLHHVTGLTCAVTFGAENLLLAARSIMTAWPSCLITLCADDDHMTPGNPGRSLATEAALAIGAEVSLPFFPAGRRADDTDFNDLYLRGGAEAVLHSMNLNGGASHV